MVWNKEDYSFKTLQNRRVTNSDKTYYEEFSDDTINVHNAEIWSDNINSSPSQAVIDGVAELRTLFVLTEDVSVPNHKSWYADDSGRLKDWISTKYGEDYRIHLYDNSNNEIFPTDTSDWLFNYQTGILVFNGNVDSYARPFKVTGYRYIGTKGGGGGLDYDIKTTYIITQPIFTEDSGLNVDYTAGSWKYLGTIYSVSASSLALTDDKTDWYIYVQGDNSLHQAASVPDGTIGIAKFSTSGGSITSLVNLGTISVEFHADNLADKVGEDKATAKTASTPSYSSNNYITDGDTHNTALGKLDTSIYDLEQQFISGSSYYSQVINKINRLDQLTADVVLTTTGATDLNDAIAALTDGQVLEVRTNAIYSPITIPSGKAFSVKVTDGYAPVISGQKAIRLMNGAANVIISGLTCDTCTPGNTNYEGSAITFGEHQTIVQDIIFDSITMRNCTGSAVMLSYHWSVGGDFYYTAPTLSEMSTRVAFVDCSLHKASNDVVEGANISIRGINQGFFYRNKIDVFNTGKRGMQLQDCVNFMIDGNEVYNAPGEGIKIDQIGTMVGYVNSGVIKNNKVKKADEGIDVDDVCGCLVYNNTVWDCLGTCGISLDDSSMTYFIANTCYNCNSGIILEAGSQANLKKNICFNNTVNYNILNGYTLDDSNSESMATSFIGADSIPYDPSTSDLVEVNVQDAIDALSDFVNIEFTDTVYVAKSTTIPSAQQTGSSDNPFSTIQAVLTYFGQPTSAADYQRRILIDIVEGGTYTENLTVPHRAITLRGQGITINGNITREISDEKEYGVSSSVFRGCLTLYGKIDARDNHNATRLAIKVTGNYRCKVISGETGSTTHDTCFVGTVIEGTCTADDGVVNGGAPSVGTEVLYAYDTIFKNTIEGRTFYCQRWRNSQIYTSSMIVGTIVMFEDVHFMNGDVWSGFNPLVVSTNSFTDTPYNEVYNFINCFFKSTTIDMRSGGHTVRFDCVSLTDWLINGTWGTNAPTVVLLEKAIAISYDNSVSGLTATNVQAAIDELAAFPGVYWVGVIPTGDKDGLNDTFGIPAGKHYVQDTIGVFLNGVQYNSANITQIPPYASFQIVGGEALPIADDVFTISYTPAD